MFVHKKVLPDNIFMIIHSLFGDESEVVARGRTEVENVGLSWSIRCSRLRRILMLLPRVSQSKNEGYGVHFIPESTSTSGEFFFVRISSTVCTRTAALELVQYNDKIECMANAYTLYDSTPVVQKSNLFWRSGKIMFLLVDSYMQLIPSRGAWPDLSKGSTWSTLYYRSS
jgi:hypothetical protein